MDEGDHAIFLYRIFESITIAIVKFLPFWQLHAAACFSSPLVYSHLLNSPAPQVQSPKSQVQEAVDAVVAAGGWSPLAAPAAWSHHSVHSYILFHSGTNLSFVLHRAADRSGSNIILEADWLQNPAVLVGFRYKQPRTAM